MALVLRPLVGAGNLVDGVEVEDMGCKSVGNDLDNAAIKFNSVELPYSAMLNRFVGIDSDGRSAIHWRRAMDASMSRHSSIWAGTARLHTFVTRSAVPVLSK